MVNFTTADSIQFLATFLGLTAIASVVLKLRERKPPVKVAVILLYAILPLIPIGGLYIFEYFISLVGHLSITTIVLLASVLIERLTGHTLVKANDKLTAYFTIAGASVILYPAAYGLIQFNIYSLGFGSLPFFAALMLLAILFTILRRNLAALSITLSVFAYSLHLMASNNLWDYLIDPALAIYAFIRLAGWLFRIIRPLPVSPQ